MNRKFGTCALIACFSFSNLNMGWAVESMETSPVIVQPYGTQALNQEILDRDRQNRDEEFEINKLIDENSKLTQAAADGQQDEGLARINQTMLGYRNALLSRDRARIVANGQRWWTSRYGDLIALTEDADAMTVHQDLESKSGLLTEKFQMLTDLKNEMTALNDKLKYGQEDALNQKDKIIEAYKKVADQQQVKIQMLVERLDEMDRRISHFDEIIDKKDQQIARLRDNLAMAQSEAQAKDEMIKEQRSQIDVLQRQPKDHFLSSANSIALPPIIVSPPKNQQQETPEINPALAAKEEFIKSQADHLARLQNEISVKNEIIKQQKNLIAMLQERPKDHLASSANSIELPPIIVNPSKGQQQAAPEVNPDLAAKDGLIKSQADQLAQLQSEISSKDEIIKKQEKQIAVLKARLQELSSRYEEKNDQVDLLKSEIENKIAQEKNQGPKDELIKEQEAQIAFLKTKAQELSSKDEIIKEKNDQMESLKSELEHRIAQEGNQGQKDELIKEQENQIAILRAETQELSSKDEIIKEKNGRIELLKSELERRTAQEKNQGQKDELIKDQENQIAILKAESQEVSSKNELIKVQSDQLVKAAEQFKNRSTLFANIQAEVLVLRNRLHQQDTDLKAKNEAIRWLNQVLAVAKNKAQYYQLTSQQDRLSMEQVQEQVQDIKDDFAKHFKDYNQFEDSIVSLKDQIGRLGVQLSKKQGQVDLLKSELEHKIIEAKNQRRWETQIQRNLRAQLQDKEDQIANLKKDIRAGQEIKQEADSLKREMAAEQEKMDLLKQDLMAQLQGRDDQITVLKTEILTILRKQTSKESDFRNAFAQGNDRVKLAKQLIGLQQEEAGLLDEKSNLALQQYNIFEGHFNAFEGRMKALLADHQIQSTDFLNQMEGLKGELYQKERQVESLYAELKNKIAQEKDQGLLAEQIQDLKAQLQDSENRINTMKSEVQSGQEARSKEWTLRQQLADQQNKTVLLKQELDSKTAESDKMTVMMGEYQKKLESKDNAYNEQLGQILSFKNYQAQLEKQTDVLSAQLQEKEAQVIKIKKDMYDLQEMTIAKDKDVQAKDLNLSLIQQKMMDERIREYQDKINGLEVTNSTQEQEIKSLKSELALAQQRLDGMPSSDEIDFLRTGLKNATVQLKQKEEMLFQIKANADEYVKKFKEQTLEFQSVKEQLQNTYDEINRRNEDLKYKNLEVVRLKERSAISVGDLQDQVNALTQKLAAVEKKFQGKTHENKVEAIQAQLKNADAQIEELQAQLSQLKSFSRNDPAGEKLKQALDKINEQGRVINILVQKLQASGQNVDLTKDINR